MFTTIEKLIEEAKAFKEENQDIYNTLKENEEAKENMSMPEGFIESFAAILDEKERESFVKEANAFKKTKEDSIEKIEEQEAIDMVKYNNAVKKMEKKLQEVLGDNLEVYARILNKNEGKLTSAILSIDHFGKVEYVLTVAYLVKEGKYREATDYINETGSGYGLDVENKLEKLYKKARKIIQSMGEKVVIKDLKKVKDCFQPDEYDKLYKKAKEHNKKVNADKKALDEIEAKMKDLFEQYKIYCDEEGYYDSDDLEFFSLSLLKKYKWNEILNLLNNSKKFKRYREKDFEKTIIQCDDWAKVEAIFLFVDAIIFY